MAAQLALSPVELSFSNRLPSCMLLVQSLRKRIVRKWGERTTRSTFAVVRALIRCMQITTRGLIVCVLWFVGEEVTRFPVILSSWGSESGWCFLRDRFFSLMTDTINRSEMVIKCAQITTIVNCRFVESPNSQRFQAYYVCNYFTMSQYICCIKTE